MKQQICCAGVLLAVLSLAGCALDEPVADQADAIAATSAFQTALTRAMRDGMITNAEWTNQLQPLAQQFPRTASSDANALVKIWADQPTAIASSAFESIRTLLNACGYGVPRTASEPRLPSSVLIAENLTTLDADFEAVAAAAGVPAAAAIKVAVLDDGIAFNHPALAGHQITEPGALTQWDFVENDATLPATDHGTATASIAARGGPRVKILPLRIAVNSGIPSTLAFGQVVSDAIDTAAQQGCRVVSISYVTNKPADIVLIRAAMARHPETLFVLAAGNGNTQLGGPGLEPDHFLATMHTDNVMIVANATRDGVRFQASFDGSNFGTPYVDVGMRGMDLPLAIVSGYGRSRGTSSATPNVAAVAARMLLIDPSLTASELKQTIVGSVLPSAAWSGLANAGGTVDQARAIRAAAGL
ncbi:MAG TPA: S8 family serine peptidase [Kofleriaceae bacterium]|nr:S8 family serine peptidase [Kofleriaceae bacterium]